MSSIGTHGKTRGAGRPNKYIIAYITKKTSRIKEQNKNMNDFELEGTMQIDDNTKDLILKEFGYVRCFYCGTLIAPETRYCETRDVKTGATAIMCQDCLKQCGKFYITKKHKKL